MNRVLMPFPDDAVLAGTIATPLQARVSPVAWRHFPDGESLVTLDDALAGADVAILASLRNADALFAILDRHPQARAVLWGHIHQEFDQMRGNLRLLASPSTCVQFAPGSEDFQVGNEAPGYRWLRLHADGGLDTGVSRVNGIHFEVDYSVKGY